MKNRYRAFLLTVSVLAGCGPGALAAEIIDAGSENAAGEAVQGELLPGDAAEEGSLPAGDPQEGQEPGGAASGGEGTAGMEASGQGEDALGGLDLGLEEGALSSFVESVEVVSESVPQDDAAKTAEAQYEAELRETITGFAGIAESDRLHYYSELAKPSLAEITAGLPRTWKVRLNGDRSYTEIPVTWVCAGENYDGSAAHYFQFSPKWDEGKYVLADGMDYLKNVPYYAVAIVPAGEGSGYLAGEAQREREDRVYCYLTEEMGLSSAAACGVMANILYESGFNCGALGDGGTSYGICQWHNGRWTSLRSWCQENGYDWASLTGQLAYLKAELSDGGAGLFWGGASVRSFLEGVPDTADGAYDAAYHWCYYYEMPQNKEYASIIRGNLARNSYWKQYGGKTAEDLRENRDFAESGIDFSGKLHEKFSDSDEMMSFLVDYVQTAP